MSDQTPDQTPTDDSALLPNVTVDETAEGWSEPEEDDDITFYLEARPPHHE